MIAKKYELQLLGRLLADKGTYFENSDQITADLFRYYPEIFGYYQKAYSEGRQPTVTKILAEFPWHIEDIKQAVKKVDYSIPIQELISELAENSRMAIIDGALTKAGMQKSSESKMQVLGELLTGVAERERIRFFTGFEIALEVIKNIETKKHIGIETGFGPFDKLTGGLQKTDLVIIAAESSQGKTALALNIAQNVIEGGYAAFFMSFEMSKEQLIMRMVSSKAEAAKNDMLRNMAIFHATASEFQNLPLYVSDIGKNSVENVAAAIRTAKLRFGIQVVFIDYLQLLERKESGSREQEVGQTARMLKNIAKELDICVVCLSQLSRPKVHGHHKPTMARLRDSGQIEEAADVIWFIYRPEVYGIEEYEGINTTGLAEMIIAKGRNYGTGKWKTEFKAGHTKFSGGRIADGNGSYEALAGGEEPF